MDKQKKGHVIAQVLFLIYMALLFYLLFFAESAGRKAISGEYHYNFIPFETVRLYLTYGDLVGSDAVIWNLYGNVIGFLPFGFFLPIVLRRCRKFWITVLLTAVFSAAVELLQLVTKVGSCDIDDLILNTIGGALGYLLFLMFIRIKAYAKNQSASVHGKKAFEESTHRTSACGGKSGGTGHSAGGFHGEMR